MMGFDTVGGLVGPPSSGQATVDVGSRFRNPLGLRLTGDYRFADRGKSRNDLAEG